jgi:hypothetical protein
MPDTDTATLAGLSGGRYGLPAVKKQHITDLRGLCRRRQGHCRLIQDGALAKCKLSNRDNRQHYSSRAT